MHRMLVTLVLKELTEGVRSYKFLIWSIICGIFGILSPLSAYYMPEVLAIIGASQNITLTMTDVTYRDAVDQYVKNFTQIGSIIMIFLTMGSVAGEKSDGSLQFLLVRPVSLRAILLSKILCLVCMVMLGLFIATTLACLYSQYLFSGFPLVVFIRSNMLLMLYLLVLGVVTISLSAMVKRPITAGLGSLGLWLVFSALGAFGDLGWFSFTTLGKEMIHLVEGIPVSWKPLVSSVLVMSVSVGCALFVFKRWEPSH